MSDLRAAGAAPRVLGASRTRRFQRCAHLGLILGLGGVGLEPDAWAQAGQPSVTANPINLPNAVLNQEQRDREEGGRDAREFVLSWTISNAGGRLFRLSFNRDDITSEELDLVPVLTLDENRGNAVDGTRSVRVSEDALLARAEALTSTGTRQIDLTVHILVFIVDDTPGEDSDVVRDAWTFRYDVEPPSAPPLEEARPGERTLRLQWRRPDDAQGLEFYEVQYCTPVSVDDIRALRTEQLEPAVVPDSSTAAYRLESSPCSNPRVRGSIQEANDNIRITEGIEEGAWLTFSLLAQDEAPFRNLTEDPPVFAIRTEPASDFFERQRELGGEEDGGFCFIATAAYGSYAHPTVRVLRAFRDYVLAPLPFGPRLIQAYYRHSPPIAEAIAQDPSLAAWVRLGLVLLAIGLVSVPLAAGVVGLVWIFWGLQGLRKRWGLGVFLLPPMFLLGLPGSAGAQSLRPEVDGGVGVAFEVKAGPFLPEIGEEPAPDVTDDAWDQVYGGGRTRVLVSIGGELQFLRGRFGTLSIGGTAGFVAWEGRALVLDGERFARPGPQGSSTFNMVPMTLTLGYRFDALMDRTPIPLAPYVRGGLAYTLWWNTRDDGSLSRFDENGEERQAIGGQPGLVGTVGISLALNAIDRTSAAQLHATTGIRTTYVFFEGQGSWVDGFGDGGFDFSEITWLAGLMIEL